MTDMRFRPERLGTSRGVLKGKIIGALVAILVLVILGGAVLWLLKALEARATEKLVNQYALGKRLFDEGKHQDAAQALSALVRTARKSEYVEDGLRKLGEIEEKAGNYKNALLYWQRLAQEYADRPAAREATYHIGLCFEKEPGQRSKAEEFYQRTVALDTGGPYAVLATCGLGRLLESDGKIVEARDLYKKAFQMAQQGSSESKEAVKLLGDANVKIIFSGRKTDDSVLYTVKPGDTVTSLGVQFNTTQALLLKANGIADPAGVRVNRTIKITPKKFNILIKKSTFTLTLSDDTEVFKVYPIGIGAPEHPTAAGKYKIETKMVNPTWYSPSGKVVPPGSPENELGTRWMGLKPLEPGLPPDLGIHATINPSSIGWASSRGCPRMYQADAEELFDLVTLGTPVTIAE